MSSSELRYFTMAERTARQATCPRASVGCVIVLRNQRVLVGFNGSSDGVSSCREVGCLMEGGHCIRAVHAEMRVLALAARTAQPLEGAMAFTTLLPCLSCLQALHLAGVNVIYYDQSYERTEREHVHLIAEGAGIRLIERTRS